MRAKPIILLYQAPNLFILWSKFLLLLDLNYMRSINMVVYLTILLSSSWVLASEKSPATDPMAAHVLQAEHYLNALVGEDGIGVRLPGSEAEIEAANYIQTVLEDFGYKVERQNFDYINRRTKAPQSSQNIIAHKPGTSGKSIILGGHYDSTSAELGSLGAVDNGASIAVILTIAKMMAELEQQEYGVTFIAFGAEEVGLVGAYKYVEQASAEQIASYIGMINLDGIVGSDNLYIHSAHSTPYACQGNAENYTFDPSLRNQLYTVASQVTATKTFQIHPGFEGYPKGETGGWSDHAPFACAGIPIGNFESTNFDINGQSGRDGYSQSTHPALWTCFDEDAVGPCDRETEQKWGKIWHTGADRLDVLEPLFPGRIHQQLHANLSVLAAFFSNLDKNVAAMAEQK
jgi:putative aminopeptidase FrvX